MCRPGLPTAFCMTPLWAVLPPAKYKAGPEARVFHSTTVSSAYRPPGLSPRAGPHGAQCRSLPELSLGYPLAPYFPEA